MILGIDVAKAKIDVVLFNDKQFIASGQFNNTPAGFKRLSKWLNHKDAGQVWACMESTGRYGDAVATYLHKQGVLGKNLYPLGNCANNLVCSTIRPPNPNRKGVL